MTSLWFDLGSTSKILNLSLLRFNERSEFENLDYSETKTLYLFYFSVISYKLSYYEHNSCFRCCDGTKVTQVDEMEYFEGV